MGESPDGQPSVTDALGKYRQLERRLQMTREQHGGKESAGEDATLDKMDAAWRDLGDDERALLTRGRPRCWPTEP